MRAIHSSPTTPVPNRTKGENGSNGELHESGCMRWLRQHIWVLEPIAWAASDPKGGISICESNTQSATILPARGGSLATATKTPA